MNGARLAIESITSQRMSLLRKRQTNDSRGADDEEDDGKYHHHDHDDHHDHDHGKWDIRHSVPGEPTIDYPVYAAVPSTMFTCTGLPQGYYADKEARCQVFHVCSTPPLIVKSSFLCPNGSIFSQEHSVCEWWNMVNCTGAELKPGLLSESDLENKNIDNDSMAIIQSFTDDQSLNSNKEQNKVIETDPGDSVINLDDNDGSGILAITDESSSNFNSNRTVVVSSMLNESSSFFEENKKGMIEAAKEDNASNLVDDKKQKIVPIVEDSGYVYEDPAKKNISVFLEDFSNSNKYENKSLITTSNKDESGVSLENSKSPGYVYETPKTPFTYPTVTTPTTSTPDFYLDFDLEPRKSDGNSAITSIDPDTKYKPFDETKTNLNNLQINSINEGIYNAFTPTTSSTPGPGYDYSGPISTSNPFIPDSTTGYSYSPPSTVFSYPNEIKQTSNSKINYQEDSRYTTAKFPSSSINSVTFKTQTPDDFPSTTLSPPTFNENTGSTFEITEPAFPKFESTSSPVPEINSNTGISQSVSTGIDSADEAFNFNSLSVSNDGGSGLLNVGSAAPTPPSSSVATSVAPPQSLSTDLSNTGSIQSSTPPFRGFSGEPFSIKSSTDIPFDNKQLVSQVSQTFEDENGTVITRVDFKFASSENKTTSEETNSFENKTVTRVITLPSSDLPGDDFLNELNSLTQGELRVEPSSLEFESSSNPTLLPSSQETKELSSARYTTAIPITPASKVDKVTQSPSKLLIPLSNYEEQGSIETGRNSIPDVQEFASLEKYRVKPTQNTKNLAYYPNKQDFNNVLLNNKFQSSNFPIAQVAVTPRTPIYDLKFNNAFVNQPYSYQPPILKNYQPAQSSLSQNQQQNVNLLDFILRNHLPQQNYYPQQPLFNPYLPQARSLLNSGQVNNLDLTKMNYLRSNDDYNYGQNMNFLFTANNQAQRYDVPQQQNKYEQRSFQADIVPSVSFDFDSNEGIREFNLAVSTGLVRRKRREI